MALDYGYPVYFVMFYPDPEPGQTLADVHRAEILFLAACPGGVGEAHTLENFYHRLTQPLSEILALSREQYVLFSHKPYKFAQLMRHCRRIWVTSEISPDQVKAMHMTPAADPQEVVDIVTAGYPSGVDLLSVNFPHDAGMESPRRITDLAKVG